LHDVLFLSYYILIVSYSQQGKQQQEKQSHSQHIKGGQADPEQETDGTKHDICHYRRARSGGVDKPPHKAKAHRPPKDFINAFPFHRLVVFSGQGFDTPPGLVVMPPGTQNRHQTSNHT